MNLASILKALARPAPRTSSELRSDLEAIDMAALEAAVADLERQRRKILLTGSDADLAANDAAIVAANRDAERGQAAIDELKRQIAEAEKREAAADLDATATAAREAAARLTVRQAEIDQHVANLQAALKAASRDADAIGSANAKLEKAGRNDLRVRFTDMLTIKGRVARAVR